MALDVASSLVANRAHRLLRRASIQRFLFARLSSVAGRKRGLENHKTDSETRLRQIDSLAQLRHFGTFAHEKIRQTSAAHTNKMHSLGTIQILGVQF